MTSLGRPWFGVTPGARLRPGREAFERRGGVAYYADEEAPPLPTLRIPTRSIPSTRPGWRLAHVSMSPATYDRIVECHDRGEPWLRHSVEVEVRIDDNVPYGKARFVFAVAAGVEPDRTTRVR